MRNVGDEFRLAAGLAVLERVASLLDDGSQRASFEAGQLLGYIEHRIQWDMGDGGDREELRDAVALVCSARGLSGPVAVDDERLNVLFERAAEANAAACRGGWRL